MSFIEFKFSRTLSRVRRRLGPALFPLSMLALVLGGPFYLPPLLKQIQASQGELALLVIPGENLRTLVRFSVAALFAIQMEFVARYAHRFLWHSRDLWWLHGQHHHQIPKPGDRPIHPKRATEEERNSMVFTTVPMVFELNDLFPVFFAVLSILIFGFTGHRPLHLVKDLLFGAATGISLYGFSYFFGHDVCAHERFGKGIAGFFRRVFPYLDECARVHHTYHHNMHEELEEDPYGPPYGFWLGPREIEAYKKKGTEYLETPRGVKLCLRAWLWLTVGAVTAWACGLGI